MSDLRHIKAITWDVFGTLADWRGGIVDDGRRIFPGKAVDWERFAVDWSRAYADAVRVHNDRGTWEPLHDLLKAAFYPLAERFGLLGDDDDAWPRVRMSQAWSRLQAFPDVRPGFDLLAGKVRLAALSNADGGQLVRLDDTLRLPWDELVGSDECRKFKPDPGVYVTACDLLGLEPAEVLHAAAHTFDLNAARKVGMRTALITREGEPGGNPANLDHDADLYVRSVDQLAIAFLTARAEPATR